ncbi:hypothetical protein G7K_1985-t1 [Saitoella complicata NRRL Y-17804]|uniref:Uncharacterized protein n=1 Tax=Saitoella complicata (strain BCRC 22490 / CBS 7301 / JCM 7358 / NBRC 10748 / NRRL Y-17804) TaxID=698492 RepID=A0A0E9ND55_SAICN|nr:hypothetical protein G7K_1985-t1 [Saitoella complicata NRRL Y-17804]
MPSRCIEDHRPMIPASPRLRYPHLDTSLFRNRTANRRHQTTFPQMDPGCSSRAYNAILALSCFWLLSMTLSPNSPLGISRRRLKGRMLASLQLDSDDTIVFR